MTLWLAHSPLREEDELSAQGEGAVSFAWELPDLSQTLSAQERLQLLREAFPDEPPEALVLLRQQVEFFLNGLLKEDRVILLLRHAGVALCGEVKGGYEYRPHASARHLRAIEWQGKPVPLEILEKYIVLPPPGVTRLQPIEDRELAETLQRRFALPVKNRKAWQAAIAIFFVISQLLFLLAHWSGQ